MAKRKPLEKELDRRCALIEEITRTVVRVLSTGIKWAALVGIAYLLFDAVKSFSGETTEANILIGLIADLKINQWLGYVVGGGGLLYGGIRTWQLKRTRKDHAGYIRKLELLNDPKRQSSRLDQFGEPNEDDR
ncbi:MAG: hypothetical protein LBK62_00740 [Treponema sp.]|jgi:hypothetical protein|nr:hypothetical protein [Treponema sp.]